MPPAADIIAIAADHAGFALKEVLKEDLLAAGHQVMDLGTADGSTSVDYPDFGAALARAIAGGQATRGVVVCGTGIGISIAANREPKVRCALCHDVTTAKLAREHNDANVIAFGARIIGAEVARDALRAFLTTAFAGGRHIGRVGKLSTDSRANLKAIA